MLVFFVCGVFSFFMKWNHVVNMLVSLELLVLSLFVFLVVLAVDSVVVFLFLILVVSDSVLGLLLLLLMVRVFGNDQTSVLMWGYDKMNCFFDGVDCGKSF